MLRLRWRGALEAETGGGGKAPEEEWERDVDRGERERVEHRVLPRVHTALILLSINGMNCIAHLEGSWAVIIGWHR